MPKHNDCANFAVFDVAKGYCLANDGLVVFDDDSCPKFTAKAKCKNCANFADMNEEGVGNCTGLEDNCYWTIGERIAVNCCGYVRG